MLESFLKKQNIQVFQYFKMVLVEPSSQSDCKYVCEHIFDVTLCFKLYIYPLGPY